MKRLLLVLGACALLHSGIAPFAAAQCDPGMPVSEIIQDNVRTGWVARTELARGGYTEHWCLLSTFQNFGAERTTGRPTKLTGFRSTGQTFDANAFTALCRASSGRYHVATVDVRF
jgi:hypothetical protein